MNSSNLYFFYIINGLAGQYYLLDTAVLFLTNYLAYGVSMIVVLFVCIGALLGTTNPLNQLRALAQAGELLISLALSGFITFILKMLVAEPRPFTVLSNVQALSPYESGYSFPSAHATIIFTIAASTYFYNKRLGVMLYIFAFLVAISRLYVGVHYPVDIVIGAGIGVVIAWGIHAVFKKK